jgi:hypothetical protein
MADEPPRGNWFALALERQLAYRLEVEAALGQAVGELAHISLARGSRGLQPLGEDDGVA